MYQPPNPDLAPSSSPSTGLRCMRRADRPGAEFRFGPCPPAMAGGAGRNVASEAPLVDFFAVGQRSSWRSAKWPGIEILEMVCQRRQHRRTEYVRDVEHDRVGSPALDKGPQLGLDVVGLLSRQSRHREISQIALSRSPWQVFSIPAWPVVRLAAWPRSSARPATMKTAVSNCRQSRRRPTAPARSNRFVAKLIITSRSPRCESSVRP